VSCPVRILHGVQVRSPVSGRALVSLWQVSSRSVHVPLRRLAESS
jgi:hypothetical protein